jgi:Rrf2 family protein
VQLTRKASYGLIAAVALSRHEEAQPVSARSLAEAQGLPTPFVEKILNQMKHAGLVTSRAGRGGGYRLARPARDVSVRDVLQALEEPVDLVQCLGASADPCQLAGRCPTRSTWRSINDRFQSILAAWTLEDLNRAAPAPDNSHGNDASSPM